MSDKIKRIAFACDHRGFEIKEAILQFLKKEGMTVQDFGTSSAASMDYTDTIFPAAEALSQGKFDRAIGVCYTGIGSSIAANKVRGVRASLVHTPEEARLTRAHNDSNMLILGAGFMDRSLTEKILEVWLHTEFEGGRHEQRVDKIKSYEKNHG